MRKFLLALFLISFNINTKALGVENDSNVVVIKEKLNSIHFHKKILKWKYAKSSSALIEVINAKQRDFVANDINQEIDYGYNQTMGWSKFKIRNQKKSESILLKIQQSRVDSVQLFVKRGNKIESFEKLTKRIPIYFRKIQSNDFVYELNLAKNEEITCYLYSYRQFGNHADVVELTDKQWFISNERYFTFTFALIIGLSSLVAFLSLAIFVFTSQKTYLYYSIYSISYIFLFLGDSGFLHSYIELPNFQFQISYATTIFYFMALATHVLFTTELFELSSTPNKKWLYRIGLAGVYLFVFSAFALLFFPLNNQIKWITIYYSYFILFFVDLYILATIVVSLNKKLPITYFFLVGFLLTLFVGTVLILANIGLIDNVNQSTNIYYATPLLEILILVFGFSYTFSENLKEKFNIQKKMNKTQKEIIETQENERKRIGQDLHDDVGNTLAAIKTRLNNQYPEDVQFAEIIQNAIESVRMISHNLMPVDFKKNTLVDVLAQTLRKLDNRQIEVEFITAGDKISLSHEVSLEIYRIFNEVIHNMYLHAKATVASVQLIFQEESIVLTIEDNGIGFDTIQITAETEGIGLQNMRSRAKLIGAKLTINSDQKGTLTILEIPVKK